jgi:hypothetical protein
LTLEGLHGLLVLGALSVQVVLHHNHQLLVALPVLDLECLVTGAGGDSSGEREG